MSENVHSDVASPEFEDDSELESRVASNIERQQANVERQDRLLAEIEHEVGMSRLAHDSAASASRSFTVHKDYSLVSPFARPPDAATPKAVTASVPNQADTACWASAQRQIHLWRREVDTQKRVITELRDKIAELQQAKMAGEQSTLKVRVVVRAAVRGRAPG